MQFCKKESEQTKTEISEMSNKLRNLVTTTDYMEITNAISINEKSRNNDLTSDFFLDSGSLTSIAVIGYTRQICDRFKWMNIEENR